MGGIGQGAPSEAPDCPGTLSSSFGAQELLGLWPQGVKLRQGMEEIGLEPPV